MEDDLILEEVALRKESVDRNGFGAKLVHSFLSSLSARRAWIEMTFRLFLPSSQRVALRKESVDRNTSEVSERVPLAEGRSPQGERG